MKILFLGGGTQEPSSRFRIHQFIPHLREHGIECVSHNAYGDAYNRITRTPVGPLYKTVCRLGRAVRTATASGYDAVFLQRTAIPHTALPERLAALRHARLIYDFDDAVFLGAQGEADGPREHAFRDAVRVSAHVIAGNAYLGQYAGAPEKTTVIPTVIDTDRYSPDPAPRGDDGRRVIGWMGTSGNFGYLPLVVPAVERILAEFPGTVFRIVSNARFEPLAGHPGVEQVEWSAAEELSQLRSFDVGLMPLPDDPWTRGKCGFKMIQYMATGCPVVVSAVGANREILDGSGAGLMVEPGEDWYPALRAMLADAGARRAMGVAARARAVGHYSIRAVLGTYLEVLERVARGGR